LQGEGTFFLADGTVIKGQFKDNKFTHPEILSGKYLGQSASGLGKRKRSNGFIEEGFFKDGELNGHGRRLFRNGNILAGSFINGRIDGKGFFKFANGSKIVGTFSKGKLTADNAMLVGTMAAAPSKQNEAKEEYTYEIDGKEYSTKPQ
jgi:hypothetical protein